MIVPATAAFLLLGVLVGRWWIVGVPFVLWPVWFGIEHARGAAGELWWLGFLVVLATSVALAALGVLLRRSGFGHRDRFRHAGRARGSS